MVLFNEYSPNDDTILIQDMLCNILSLAKHLSWIGNTIGLLLYLYNKLGLTIKGTDS